jgi:hypothetical protein
LAHFGILFWPTLTDFFGEAVFSLAGTFCLFILYFIYIGTVVEAVGMWESRQRFPRAVERVENLGLVFQAFHGPTFPQLY